jgi:hypothetical protein
VMPAITKRPGRIPHAAAIAALGLAALLGLAPTSSCGGGSGDAPRIAGATPDHGPLTGGTAITLTGAGFLPDAGDPVRVLVAGREAPLAIALEDATLQVVIPFGDRPGDAELVVVTGRGSTRATGVFRYSAPPEITAVAPADVLFSSSSTRVTVTGSGFQGDDAGEPMVAVGDQLATDVVVESDTQLSFTAPAGVAFAEPSIVISSGRGTAARDRGFRYVPSLSRGLLLFPRYSSSFVVFVDPVELTMVQVPWTRAPETRFSAVVRDDLGTYWGYDRAWRFGRIDMSKQTLVPSFQNGSWYPTIVRANGEHYAIARYPLQFGKLDPFTGTFTQIGTTAIPCCSSYGLAFDGTRFYYTVRQGASPAIRSIDPATGAQGPAVQLATSATFHVEEMRFFDGKLYATSRDGSFASIDPATGAVTPLLNAGRNTAMEVFEPAAPRPAP